jgi:hypothetical protein
MTDLLKLCDNTFEGVLTPIAMLPPPLRASHPRLRGDKLTDLGLEAAIQDEARSWLGTPFKHQGRMKGVGCDCLGLLIGVAKALNLQGRGGQKLADLDNLGYGHFPDEGALRRGLENALYPAENLSAGCIVLMKIDGRAQHLGIVGNLESGGLSLIHTYAPHRKVVEHHLTEEWQEKMVAVFRSYNAD